MFGQVECREDDCGLIIVRAQLKLHRREKHGVYEEGKSEKREEEEGVSDNDDDNDSDNVVRLALSTIHPLVQVV